MGMYDNEDYLIKKRQVINAYPSFSWEWKVNRMKPNQVLAIWNSIQERKAKEKRQRELQPKQLSLFELFPEVMVK